MAVFSSSGRGSSSTILMIFDIINYVQKKKKITKDSSPTKKKNLQLVFQILWYFLRNYYYYYTGVKSSFELFLFLFQLYKEEEYLHRSLRDCRDFRVNLHLQTEMQGRW